MARWKKVYATGNLQLVEILKNMLEEAGFHPIVINKTVSGYLLGSYEIHVSQEDDILKAIKLINEYTQ
ncbi:MAG: DUF2007 domain-containing protein [Cytophagales bacterium]|nr:DUF2007 domain-containing protein [Cytophagales bacterium]